MKFFTGIFQSRGVSCFSLSKNLCSLAFPFRAGFACFVTDCRLSFVFLGFAFDITPCFPLSGKVARSADRGLFKILPYVKPSPCFFLLSQKSAKIVSLFHRLPLGGEAPPRGGGEGRNLFSILIISIKGCNLFALPLLSPLGKVAAKPPIEVSPFLKQSPL